MSLLSRRRLFTAGAALSAASVLHRKVAAQTRGTAFAYVGSFSYASGPEGNSRHGKGISLFEADLTTGALRQREITTDGFNPWWIAIHPSKQFLYAANEITSNENRTSGSINAYAVDAATGHLSLLNSVSSHGGRPAQVSVHPSGKYVLSANFGGGNIAVFPVSEEGRLGEPTDVKEGEGKPGPRTASSGPKGSFADSGHDRSHPHMVQADPSGRFILETDLGLDEIVTWKLDVVNGKLTRADVPAAKLPPGDGPRHFAFHPSGSYVYSLQEEGCTIAAFKYDGATGQLTALQTVSTVPPGFAGSDYTSEVIVSPDGKFVYAANRLYDSIVYFRIEADGRLSLAGEEWACGDFPRHLAFDPTHSFLYCCNQRSDAIATFKVHRDTGSLTFTGKFTPVGTPAILLFL